MKLCVIAASKNAPAPHVPDALKPPAGDILKAKLRANGVQIHQCQGTKWRFPGPHARYPGPAWKFVETCSAGNANEVERVPYAANYYFYAQQ
jgi:hypothetical protein